MFGVTRGELDRPLVSPGEVAEPLIVSWQGRDLRVRHDDPHLGPYTPRGAVIRSAVQLDSDVAGQVRLYLQDIWPARAIAATSADPIGPHQTVTHGP